MMVTGLGVAVGAGIAYWGAPRAGFDGAERLYFALAGGALGGVGGFAVSEEVSETDLVWLTVGGGLLIGAAVVIKEVLGRTGSDFAAPLSVAPTVAAAAPVDE